MKKCIRLAKKAEGKTSPNPMVGCVILDKNGKELSSGYHKGYGKPHAEANALNKLKNDEARGGTLIVNLEPCSHWGKTPPCADLIIKKGLKKVVIGMRDPNPLVAGNGINKCKDAGIEIIEGVLEDDVKTLNEVFIKNMEQNCCFVAIKTATTLDGKIATKTGSSKWITSEKARIEVQKIRNRYDAILTSSSTVIIDNPSMNCNKIRSKNPIKVVIDRELKTDLNSKIYEKSGQNIYIAVDKDLKEGKIAMLPRHITPIKCQTYNNKIDILHLIKELYNIGIKSVLIEAGGRLNGEIISLDLADKIYHFIAPKILGDTEGINAFAGRNIQEISNTINFEFISITDFKPDILITYKVSN